MICCTADCSASFSPPGGSNNNTFGWRRTWCVGGGPRESLLNADKLAGQPGAISWLNKVCNVTFLAAQQRNSVCLCTSDLTVHTQLQNMLNPCYSSKIKPKGTRTRCEFSAAERWRLIHVSVDPPPRSSLRGVGDSCVNPRPRSWLLCTWSQLVMILDSFPVEWDKLVLSTGLICVLMGCFDFWQSRSLYPWPDWTVGPVILTVCTSEWPILFMVSS